MHGGIHVNAHQAPGTPTPRQLPQDIAFFTGRAAALHTLNALVVRRQAALTVVSGMPGVGKTALVVRWAHRMRNWFPDGDLYVDLRGFSADPAPATEDVLELFLHALNVPADRIPRGLASRTALYRSVLNRRQVLIVLDNAASSRQVRQLLPAAPGCLVVVTSRRRLSGLEGDGALALPVEPMLPHEATVMLAKTIGAARTDRRRRALTALAYRCGHLPLALRNVAEQARSRPEVAVADLATTAVDALAASTDDTTSVRRAVDWSYEALPDDAARVFRITGLHAGPRMCVAVVAAMADVAQESARRLLDVLVDNHLLTRVGRDQYGWHPLLYRYAAQRAATDDTTESGRDAVRRMLEWYLRGLRAADRVARDALLPAVADTPFRFATRGDALAWCDLERANIVAAVRQAARDGHETLCWQLAQASGYFFALRKNYADWMAVARTGLEAARWIWDESGEAQMLVMLGLACTALRQCGRANRLLRESVAVWWALGDRSGPYRVLDEINVFLAELTEAPVARDLEAAFRQVLRSGETAVCLAEAQTVRMGRIQSF